MFCERCGNRLVKISPEENSGGAGPSGGYIPGRDGRPFRNLETQEPADQYPGYETQEPADQQLGYETQEPADQYPGYETQEPADQYLGYETQESEDSYYEYDPYQEYNQQTDEGGYSVSEAAARNQRISGSAGGQGFPGAGRQDFSGTGRQDFPGAERGRQGFSGAGGQRRSEASAGGPRVSEAAARLNRTYSEVSSGGRPAAPAISKGLIAVIIEACVLVAALFLLYSAVTKAKSPEKVAERYFVSLVNGDYAKAFSLMNIEESSLVNRDSLGRVMSDYDFSRVSTYTVQSHSSGSGYSTYDGYDMSQGSELGRNVTILYRNEGDESDSWFDVSVTKSGKKGGWYVSSNQLFANNLQLVVPSGAEVSIDGVTLEPDEGGDYSLTDNGDGTAAYQISRLFTGRHLVTVAADGREEAARVWEVYGDGDYYEVTDLLYSEAAINNLQTLAAENMRRIYQGALSGQDFSELAGIFTSDQDMLEIIRQAYENMREELEGEYTQVNSLDFYNMQAYSQNYEARVTLSFEYQASYTQKSWSDELTNENIQNSDSLDFVFVQENGNWVQTSLGCDALYF